MQRLEDTLSYPGRGRWLNRTVIGSLLVLGSPLLVPLVVLVGYGVQTLETTLEGADEPPAFADWGSLLVTGIGGIVIGLVYLLGPLLIGTALALAVGVVGYSGLAGLAPAVGSDSTLVWAISAVAALVAAFFTLVFVSLTLVSLYVLPAALARYAATGDGTAAFDRTPLARIASSRDYFFAMVALQVVPLVVPVVAVVCLLTVVGIVALPGIAFLAWVVCCRLVGLGVAATTADERFSGTESIEAT